MTRAPRLARNQGHAQQRILRAELLGREYDRDTERVRVTQRGLLVGNQVFAMFLREGPDDELHLQ